MTIRNILAAAALGLLATAACAANPPQAFDVAITVDDLPRHGSPTPGMSREAIARTYLAALKTHGVPQAWGFVNAVGVVREPDSEIVLKLWREAGYPLGNHTWSHVNLDQVGVDAFEQNVVQGEPILRHYMAGQDWHTLRFPFLVAGNAQHHAPIMAWLREQHYRIADVSISFDDWSYTEAYNRCLGNGDSEAIAQLKSRYLAGVDTAIERMKKLSDALYGHLIPQVLLSHGGGFTATMAEATLGRLQAAGAHFVTLEQAEGDPAYDETAPDAANGLLLERVARQRAVDLSALDLPPMPDPGELQTVCPLAPAPAPSATPQAAPKRPLMGQ